MNHQQEIISINNYLDKFHSEDIFIFPTSSGQARLCFLAELEPDSFAYNEQFIIQLKGKLDISKLKQSFNEIVRRHEILRTLFTTEEGQPFQVIVPNLTLKLPVIDLTDLVATEQERVIKKTAINEVKTPFNLTEIPLIRLKLLQLNEEENLLIITSHHIIADGWSGKILMEELAVLYEAFCAEKSSPLPPLEIQYADFALWQNNYIQEDAIIDQLNYWKDQLEGSPSLLKLPTDYSRPPVQTYQGSCQHFQLTQELTEKLQHLSKNNGTTLFMSLLTGWSILLSKYSQETDLVIGSPIANRNRTEIESLIGFFVNSLALRIDLSNNPTVSELLQRVKQVCFDAYDNQDVPFEKLVETLKPERNLSNHPIYQVMFILQNANNQKFKIPGLDLKIREKENIVAKLDLTLEMQETQEGIRGKIEYRSDLFKPATIERMIGHFQNILVEISTNPTQPINNLCLLTSFEKEQILNQWNHTQTDYAKDKGIHQLFEEQVVKTPDAVALEFQGQQLTYEKLNQQANQLAHYLRSLGVDSGVLVGICFEPSMELLVSVLGVLKANGIYVPLDPNYPQERLTYMLEDAKMQILLTQEPLIAKIPPQQAQIVCLDRDKQAIAQQSSENLASDATLEDLVYVIYTSGSTGRPKGVLGKMRGLINRLHWMWESLPFADDEVCVQKTSINFVDHVAEIFLPLLQGIPLIIVPKESRGDVLGLMNLLKEHNVTRLVLVPSLLKAMIDSAPQELSDLRSLKYFFCSGEALPLSLAEEFHQTLSAARLFNLYGSSEVSADVTYFEVNFWETGQRILQYFKPEVVRGASEDGEQKPFTRPGVSSDMLAKQFQRSELPLYPVTVDDYYEQFSQEVLPYVIDTSSPTFIGHMTSALPDFLHDMSKLISQLNQNLVKIETSKSLLFVEREAIAMLHRLVYNFSEDFYQENIQQTNRNLGLVTTGGTTANISALLCARNAGLLNTENPWELSRDSLYQVLSKKGYEDIVIIGSRLMHYSLNKAASMLGLGTNNIVLIDSNSDGKLNLNQVEAKIEECRNNRLYILALVGIAGTTETGEIDPLSELGEIAQKYNIHFHVDGAWGGPTVFSDKHKGKLKGIEKADSVTICGHKQLYLPQGISVCLFKDPQLLNFAATTARYQAQRNTYDVGRFTIEGSRSALSLCLHGALHIIGKKGYEILINNGIEKAQYFAQLIDRLEPLELIRQPVLNIVNYRYIPDDLREKVQQKALSDDEIQRINQLNQQIQKEQFEQGRTFVSKTTLLDPAYGQEIVVFRTVLSNPNTTASDLHRVLEDQLRIAYQIEARNQGNLNVNLLDNLVMPEMTAIAQEGISLRFTEDPNADLEEYLKKNTIPIGKPIANTQIYILDNNGNLLPPGLTGELYVGGDGLAQGYLNRPELTQDKFIPNPFSQDKTEKLYRMGDLARWLPNGNIEFIGRVDRQVKIRGFRIELGEIESVLNSHPQVKETVVIATEQLPNDKRLVAYVISEDDSLNLEQLRDFLKEKLPDYMIPTAWVPLQELPLNPNGKVDRKALPLPDQGKAMAETPYIAPRTPVEEIIVNIWQQVLNVEQVGIEDNFFELGGHSLMATKVISKIRQSLSVELPLRSLFEHPTVVKLAEQLNKADTNINIPPIRSVSREGELPLSFAQQRLWFLEQLEETNAAYNLSGALRLKGVLNIEALSNSINAIIARHEVLRTNFKAQAGKPVQIIKNVSSDQYLEIKILEIDPDTEINQLINQEATNPFDLSQDHLIRVSLIPLEKEENILLITLHHIISDGWSLDIFIKELSIFYQSYCQGETPSLPTLDIQYADFAVWQHDYLQGEIIENQINYWKHQLRGIPPLLELPTDYPRPPKQTFNGGCQTFQLHQELTEKLKELSQENEATLFMTLLSTWGLLLSKYSRQEDIVIGSPIANRNRAEIEPLIGFFVNTLVMRIDFSNDLNFHQLIEQVKQVCLEAYQYQDIPFEKLVEELQPERNLSHTPLFQVMFILQNANNQTLELSGLDLDILDREHRVAKFDLTLSMKETQGELAGEIEYNTDLFEASTIERMVVHFQELLTAIATNPCHSLQKISLVTEKEKKQLLIDWNKTKANYPKNKCLHQLFEEQVLNTSDAVAIEFQGEQLTYFKLNEKANQLAYYLQQSGVKPNDLVAICMERSIEMVIGLLAILKVGGTYIPIDPAYPSERINYILEHSQVEVILTQSKEGKRQEAKGKSKKYTIIDINTIFSLPTPDTLHPTPYTPPPHLTPQDLAYIIYTSGSTGKPKGVEISHQAIVNFLWSMAQQPGINPHDVLLSVTTLSFDIAGLEIFLPLITGAKVVLVSGETAMDGVALSEKIDQCHASMMQATPATWQMLIDAGWQGKQDLKILCGGEALSQTLAKDLLIKSGELWNMYGPTETTVWSMIQKIESAENITIGRPINNTQIYILDNHLQPVPVGVPGDLYIGGDGLARGYVNRPDLTEERFINSPFFQGGSREQGVREKIYKTGDLAKYLPSGKVEYIGRSDYQVKIRGFRIELGEIESQLNQHSALKNAVVIAKKEASGINRLVAYYIPKKEESVTNEKLRSYLKTKLPDYMIPSAFISLDEFPLTPNGKINRKALPELDEFVLSDNDNFVPPQTEIQQAIAAIWSEVLGLNSVSINSNFFELGGHSLLATQVISKIQEMLKVEVPIKHLFENPTIETFSSAIETASQDKQAVELLPIEVSNRSSFLPLSFSQQRLWFLEQLEGSNSAYTMAGALQLSGSLNLEALENSVNAIINRHEILRTRFTTQEGQPIQVINNDLSESSFKIKVLSVNSDDNLQELIDKEATKPFELSQDSLIRVSLIPLEKEENILVIAMHHIVSDAWSIGLFIQELSTYYQSYCQGEQLSLPPLKIQYADYAIWQRKWLKTESFEQQLNYWKNQLKDAPTCLNFPLDNPRSQQQNYQGNSSEFQLSSQLTEQLKTLSQREGSTLFMTLLTAFNSLLYSYSEDEDICLGSPIANRQRQETQNLIGFFVNTLVLRTNCSGNPTFRELLQRVKTMAIDAYSHQEVPFEKIVEALNIDRNLSYNPLFQVWFVMDEDLSSNLVLQDLSWKRRDINYRSVRHDLSLRLSEKAGVMTGYFEYKTSLFNQDTIITMQEDFKLILTALVNNPDQHLTDIKAMIDQKRQERKAQKEQALLSNMRQKLKRRKRQ
ncbi:non-ribosomal peptide synthetase [Cyanothece sp. BG0011]|uniref:non-ribosomal peptide synthetase n=1 Tax=Cyanothece sp. BG0011 TaxID=2082950 RepID=UPI000D1D633E|nr:non-ribosomal peptide synthetase [Cyanothece sp. BG0011]